MNPPPRSRLRRGAIEEEDAGTVLRLNADFTEGATCLNNAETRFALEAQRGARLESGTPITAVMQKSLEYVQTFSKFKNKETVKELTKVFPQTKEGAGEQFHPYEVTQIVNICPETSEDAKGWIPSLARWRDEELQRYLDEMQNLRSSSPSNTSKSPGESVSLGKLSLSRKKKKNDIEAQNVESEDMKQFFDEIAKVREWLTILKGDVDDMEPMHLAGLNATNSMEHDEVINNMDLLTDKITTLSTKIRNKLKQMDVDTRKAKKVEGSTVDLNMRASQQAALTKKFLEIMTQYKDVQQNYQNKHKQRMKKEILVVKPDATEEEVNQIVEQGTDVFGQTLKRKGNTAQARAALLDIQQRHGEILRIERSVIELQQLFIDMAVLVAAQDEAIQDIAQSVQKTVQYTEAGVEDLKSASKHQKRSRRCMCGILACLLVLIAVVVIVVLMLKR